MLACSMYADLNSIGARVAAILETSQHTLAVE